MECAIVNMMSSLESSGSPFPAADGRSPKGRYLLEKEYDKLYCVILTVKHIMPECQLVIYIIHTI